MLEEENPITLQSERAVNPRHLEQTPRTGAPPISAPVSAATPGPAGDLARVVHAVCDVATSAVAGRPLRVRAALSPAHVLAGRVTQLRVTIDDIELGGLAIARLTIQAREVRLVPTWPLRLRTGVVRIRAEIVQGSLDAWLRRARLPARLRLDAGGLTVRTGLRGLRLAEVRAGVEIERRRLIVTPLHGDVLGLGLAVPRVRMPLPVPPLPRGCRLIRFEVIDGRATVELELPELEEPLDGDRLDQARNLLAPRRRGDDHLEHGSMVRSGASISPQ